MRKLLFLFLVAVSSIQAVQAEEKLQLWPYIENAAIQDQRYRKIEGISYLVGGAAAIALPFLTTSSGSTLRDIGTYTLVPAGVYSVLYGGYTVLTDSPWTSLRNKVEKLSGPKEDSAQWRLRREGHAREALLERADSTRFWRYLWGSVEGGAGVLIISSSRSTPSVVTASLLFGLSAYHFLHKKADERAVDQLDRTTVGLTQDRGLFLAHQFHF
jgi:hypothetical protein